MRGEAAQPSGDSARMATTPVLPWGGVETSHNEVTRNVGRACRAI
jgi:hypothetical protein